MVKNHTIEVTTTSLKLRLDDLFKGNDELNNNFNKVIEENIDVLAKDVLPVIETTLASIFKKFINGVNSRFPIEVLYPSD